MPEKATMKRAAADKRAGKSSSTQAGEFVKEEIDHVREGKHGVKSAKQAVAIGLSKARRAGVPLKQPTAGTTSETTHKKVAADTAAGQKKSPAAKRTAAKKAVARTTGKKTAARRPSSESTAKRSRVSESVLKRESGRGASKEALSKQTKTAAAKRPAASRSAAAKKAAATKGAAGRSAAAKKAARTRATRAHH
ncbi:conserved hypothetical protein [Paraburkholderia piptadeniae]|uniref:DNA-binding protein n=1 Tax=Paraburkholderia piptadeniae TaxID=1701573 RepID=A0A1N7S3N0_9BURK|nr:DUF6496 domain-containing protein [Paraburkholderia piptadeniae]SIT41946.1 conserved hypothetical protein [Paraburkholderia piptadeniae]